MIERSASVFACDEVLYSLSGKITVSGMYTGDIIVPGENTVLNQLIFFFTAITPAHDPFRLLRIRVIIPGNFPVESNVPISVSTMGINSRRTQLVYRYPVLAQQPIARPGLIETTVIHERGMMDAGGIWISSLT
jgi:hypothetical protein